MWLGSAFPPAVAEAPVTPVALPVAELARFVGEYRDVADPFGRLVLLVHDGARAYRYDGDVYPLVALGGGRFRDGLLTFTFTARASGTAGGPLHLAVSRRGWSGAYTQRLAPAWRPGPPQLAGLEGSYRSEELDVSWTLRVVDGRLTLRRPRFPDRALEPWDRDMFELTDGYEDMTLTSYLAFQRGADGTVGGFRLTTSRVAGLEFTRSAGR